MRKVVTVGQYLIARSLKFVARPFHMTNQRSRRSSDTIGLFSFCSLVGNRRAGLVQAVESYRL